MFPEQHRGTSDLMTLPQAIMDFILRPAFRAAEQTGILITISGINFSDQSAHVTSA